MTGLEPGGWETFALGHLGASAALLGLVVVAISINLREVVASAVLVHRAAEAIILLASILLAATVLLIPDQARWVVGAELTAFGLVGVAVTIRLQRSRTTPAGAPGAPAMAAEGLREPSTTTATPLAPRGSATMRRVFAMGSTALVTVAGISLLADGGGGLYWWAAAVVLAYLGALANTWVLLIEILR
jgi:hypothetical protein